jgi:hypothetical protein
MAAQTTTTPGRGGGRGERFASGLTLGEARARLFALGGLGEDGGYADAWVVLKLWHVPLAFPNTEGRRRAVRFHDLHHVLTEYPTTWRGEFEIAAWEVAGGIRRYRVAWLLDLLGFACGLVVFPRAVYRAFVRGRHSLNLYGEAWDESILTRRVGEVRRRLRLDVEAARPTAADRVAFVKWAAASVAAYVATLAVMVAPASALAAALWRYGAR